MSFGGVGSDEWSSHFKIIIFVFEFLKFEFKIESQPNIFNHQMDYILTISFNNAHTQ